MTDENVATIHTVRRFEELVPVVDAERFLQLHAPLRVVIHASESGEAVFVIDQPSTLFGSYGSADIASVGRELDEKVAGVLAALGAEPPVTLTRPAGHAAEGVASWAGSS